MGNVTVVNAGKSNAHSPGSIAFVGWIAFSKSVKNHIAHSSESFLSSTTWTECFRAFLNFEITSIYCVNGILMVASFSAVSTYPADRAYWQQTLYSISAIVSFLIALVLLIAIRKLRNQK